MPWLRGGMSWKEDEETLHGGPAGSALGSVEDASRDRLEGAAMQNEGTMPQECWSLNSGGNSGIWRTINLLHGLDSSSRPKLIHLQETSCEASQWKTVEHAFKSLGFRAFHTMGTEDSKPTHGAWKRGVITAVSETLKSKWIEDHSWSAGQFLAIDVNGVLCVNSYVRPMDADIQKHLASLGSFLTKLKWEGRILLGGDWNETWPESWIESLAGIFGCEIQDCSQIDSTRWDNNKIIDFWCSNCPIEAATVGEEKISDHKIVKTKVDFGLLQDAKYVKFVQELQFKCPDWISVGKWHVLFREAFQLGARMQWEESIKQVEEMEWPNEIDEQGIIDYNWAMVCAKISWAFSVAASASLLYIPEDYSNLKEVQQVERMANHRKLKGVTVKLQCRHLQKVTARASEQLRKLYKKAGRLHVLSKRLQYGRTDGETVNLAKKIYPERFFSEIELNEVNCDLQDIYSKIKSKEEQDKDCNIKSWKKKMQCSIKARGNWINKQGHTLTPTVKEEQCASNRQQGAQMIHEYWKKLWAEQKWDKKERIEKSKLIEDVINERMANFTGSVGRPALSEFQAALRRISGTHGIDGWSHDELRAISSVKQAAAMIWDEMELWEDATLIPSSVAHCKLSCIPKKDKRELSPREFRPICVMSSLWRAWSSTWIRSQKISQWTKQLFPPNIAGGIPGSLGPETISAMVDHELHKHRFGASFDFKHAFDCVDLEVIHIALQKVLPRGLLQWESLLHKQWKTMSRWIVYDGSVHPSALVSPTGLPQGDPASPMMMNILMMVSMHFINQKCNDPTLFHVTYMDDRTVVASSQETIDLVEKEWGKMATLFHLRENAEKTQHARVHHNESMEVLGAMVGKPHGEADQKAKSTLRLRNSSLKYRRISHLPLKCKGKLFTANVFARSGLEYGWIASRPDQKLIKSQEGWLWKCLGRTRYSSPHMRQVIFGAHSHVQIMLLRKQFRLVAKRNEALAALGLQVEAAPLDSMVIKGLSDLGWIRRGEFWTHPLVELGFKVGDLVDDKQWRKVSHDIRESYRKLAFDLLVASNRHDAKEINVQYDAERRKLALQWAGDNFPAIMLVLGACASPFQRAMVGYGDTTSSCPICAQEYPGWDHLWQCTCGFIPGDGLMRRFLWPRTKKDFPHCSAFLAGFLQVGN